MKKRLIIVDVSSFIFRAFYAIRSLNAPDGTPVNAVHGVLSMLMKLFSQYQPTHLFIAKDTGGGSFRNELYPEYKANRSEPPEELIPQFALIKKLIEKMELPYLAHDNFEADDIIGSACTQWKNYFDEILVATGDKDLMQFVDDKVKILDTMKDKIYDPTAVKEKMGVNPDQIVDYLSMVGDTSDNIPGMKGIGAKGAAKLLEEHGTLDKCIEVKDTFKGKKLTEAFSEYLDNGLLSRKLIKIVTDVDLECEPESTKYRFYPSDDLIDYLQGLGFKSALVKLRDLQKAEFHAQDFDDSSFTHVIKSNKPEFKLHLIDSKDSFEQVSELINSVEKISFYTEYDSFDLFNRKLTSISISPDGENIYYTNCNEKGWNDFQEALLKKIFTEEIKVIGEHWKRDHFYAANIGVEIKCHFYDLSQAHYILDQGNKHELEDIAENYLGWAPEAIKKDEYNGASLEKDIYEKRIADRTGAAFLIHEPLQKEIIAHDLERILDSLDHQLIPILSKMEREGILVDVEFFKSFEIELDKSLKEIDEEIAAFCDGAPINLNSPKQVGELLFEKLELPVIKKTKTGYSTDSEVLETLDSRNLSPVPALILKHRELGKLLSTYIRALPDLVQESTGRIHTHYNQHIAATGRLSSNNPNLQNIPIRTELGRKTREGFIAKEGHVLLGADYSQVELRLLAHFSEDPTMLKAFQENQDIHRQTASEILGLPLEKVSSDERSKAKAVNFGLMYGQSSFGLASQLRISRAEAKDYITNYFKKFSSIKSYLDSLKEEAENTGYAQTLLGRKRFIPDINSTNRTVKAMAERIAINSPIQGTAADLLKLAMINIDHALKENNMKSKMLLQVHDELIFEVPENEVEQMKTLVREKMENVASLKVPLAVEIGTGKNWFDLK